MKKILLILSIIFVLSLTGCNTNKNVLENTNNQNQENLSDEIVIDITQDSQNNIQENTKNIATLSFDNENKPYVSLSDSYYLTEYKNIVKKEIKPVKIYLTENNDTIHDNSLNKDVSFNLPITECETLEEERIEYSDYGIERMLNTGKVRIGGIEIDSLYDDFRDDSSSCKEEIAFLHNLGSLKIYEIELDDNELTKELLVYAYFQYPWDFTESPYLIKYENGVATNMGLIENENLMQIGNYKNVFTDGWNSDVEGYFSNILMGYYVYDKDLGLIHVEKMANGDDITDIDINKLDNCILNCDMFFGVLDENDFGYGKAKYSRMTYSESAETKRLDKGSKIKIIEIVDEYGNFIGEAEDGTRYAFVSFAGR